MFLSNFYAIRVARSWARLKSLRCLGLNGWNFNAPYIERKCQERGLHVNSSIAEALRQKKPVVALESTIITHGMPYPQNVKYISMNIFYYFVQNLY